jgi:hypothetical protein
MNIPDNISQLIVENDDDMILGRQDDIDVSNDDIDISNLSIVDNDFDCKNDKKNQNKWFQMIVEIDDDNEDNSNKNNNIINIQKDGDISINIINEDEMKIDLIDNLIFTKESLNTKPISYLQEYEATFKNDNISIEG